MTDEQALIDRLRNALDEGSRGVRTIPPPFVTLGSNEPARPATEAPWRWITVAATVVALAAAGLAAVALTADDEGDHLLTDGSAITESAGAPKIAVTPDGLTVEPDYTYDTSPDGQAATAGVVDIVNGCVVLRSTYSIDVPVWPTGTTWNENSSAVHLPDGVDVTLGSQISATARFSEPRTRAEASPSTNIPRRAADTLIEAVPVLRDCISASGTSNVVYSLRDVRIVEPAGAEDFTAAPYELTAIVAVVETPDRGPTWCWMGIARESARDDDSPPCGGSAIVGWGWAALDHRTGRDGSRWGVYVLTGTYNADGTAFTLSATPRVPTPADYETLSIEREHDPSTPCEPPPGGWDLPPQNTTMVSGVPATSFPLSLPELDHDRLMDVPGYGGVSKDEASGVYNVRIAGDQAAREAAEAEIRSSYDGPVCIIPASYTWVDLLRINSEINYGSRALNVTSGIGGGAVGIHLNARAPEFEAHLREKYGDAIEFETMFPDPEWPQGTRTERRTFPTVSPNSSPPLTDPPHSAVTEPLSSADGG